MVGGVRGVEGVWSVGVWGDGNVWGGGTCVGMVTSV